jgi:hypothetical protein
MVLHALKIGERGTRGGTLLGSIIKKSVLVGLLLIVTTVHRGNDRRLFSWSSDSGGPA